MDGDWNPIASIKGLSGYNTEWNVLPADSSPLTFTLLAADVAALKASGMIIAGQNITLTKVEYIAAGTSSEEPETPTEPEPEEPETPTTPPTGGTTTGGTVATPTVTTVTVSADAAEDITAASEGSTVKVDLKKGVTKLDKVVFDVLAGRDVTVQFSLPGGAYWEINGEDVTDAQTVDLGVILNSNDIPAEMIADLAGDKDTKTFSLNHNGDFGFTGVLNIPVSSKYNGQYANLYYYNKRSRELEFVGSSQVSGGNVGFAFSHASDYVIVFDTFPYGDDVSSAAAASETKTAQTVPYAGIAVLTALAGVSALIIRKRLAK